MYVQREKSKRQFSNPIGSYLVIVKFYLIGQNPWVDEQNFLPLIGSLLLLSFVKTHWIDKIGVCSPENRNNSRNRSLYWDTKDLVHSSCQTKIFPKDQKFFVPCIFLSTILRYSFFRDICVKKFNFKALQSLTQSINSMAIFFQALDF